MNNAAETWRELGEIVEGTSPKVMERIVDAAGDAVLKASLSSVKRRIFDITDGLAEAEEIGSEETLTINSIWFDTFQTDAGWTGSLGGYNCAHVIPAASLAGGGVGVRKRYQIEVMAYQSGGSSFWVTRARITVTDALGVT